LLITLLWHFWFVGKVYVLTMFLAEHTCQYAYNDINVCVGFREVNLKATQFMLQKTITWTKKFDKRCNESKRHVLMLDFPIKS
jgi:hypothetical protein